MSVRIWRELAGETRGGTSLGLVAPLFTLLVATGVAVRQATLATQASVKLRGLG